MKDNIVRRTITNEQVWVIRDLHAKGQLNIASKARELGVAPRTIRNRLRITSAYPEYPTLELARKSDALYRMYAIDTGD